MRINLNLNYNSVYKSYSPNFGQRLGRTESEEAAYGWIYHTSYFFRDDDTDQIVKKYIEKFWGSKPEIRILSAGCSSGEEVYTYAMLLNDMKGKRFKISGFDIDKESISMANKGEFPCNEEELGHDIFKKYFKPLNKLNENDLPIYGLKNGSKENTFKNCDMTFLKMTLENYPAKKLKQKLENLLMFYL